jgi:phosphate transport system substrate-binding protein
MSTSKWNSQFISRLICGGFLVCLMGSGCVKVTSTSSPASNADGSPVNASTDAKLAGTINIEGSSTVFPISQALGTEFEALHPEVHLAIAGNGTGSGFKNLISRQAEICDASRPISDSEIKLCQENNIGYLELQIAIDGLTVVVNKDNDWVDTLTVAQLKQIWDEGSTVEKWKDIDPSWPDQPIELFGPGVESGTFDYFTEAVNGKAKRSRSNYRNSEADNVLVDGVIGNKYALGYFGFAYYINSSDRLKAVKIIAADGAEAVAPSVETVENGSYKPLSRPLFIYVNREALQRPEIAAFAEFYLSDAGQSIVEKRKYVRLNAAALSEMRERLSQAVSGK